VPYEEETWDVDNSQVWFTSKAKLFPGANLPYIKDGDLEIAETIAVQEYIASKYMPEVVGTTP